MSWPQGRYQRVLYGTSATHQLGLGRARTIHGSHDISEDWRGQGHRPDQGLGSKIPTSSKCRQAPGRGVAEHRVLIRGRRRWYVEVARLSVAQSMLTEGSAQPVTYLGLYVAYQLCTK